MKSCHPPRTLTAFTRVELLAVVAALLFVISLAVPLIGHTRADVDRAGCASNLRALGHAAHLWGNDHNDLFPWITFVDEGGTKPRNFGKTAAAWVEFSTLSNHLASPRALACPRDLATRSAAHWGNTTDGFVNSGQRANALSYFLNFHGWGELPRSVIAGDRDLRPGSPGPLGCSRSFAVNTVGTTAQVPTVWTNEVHVGAGHLLFVDGSVEYVNSIRLSRVLGGPDTQDDAQRSHLINAR
jgi:competence protein ComGC